MVHLGFFQFVSLSACFLLKAPGEHLILEPSRLVVEYGAKASANCSTTASHLGIGWEASQGAVKMVQNVQLITWTVQNLTHWDIKPLCYINLKSGEQVSEELPVTIYKLPDTLNSRSKNCSGPVIEGESCLLQCDIHNVAPLLYLKVLWYKQWSLINETTFNNATFNKTTKSVTIDVGLIVQPSRNDDGTKYWCEAKLELGSEGPQPPPRKKSDPLSIVVHYKPAFSNDTEIIEVGDEEIILNCTSRANPPPKYTWDPLHLVKDIHLPVLRISVPHSGNYTCTASNQYGRAKKLFIIRKHEYHSRIIFYAVLGTGLCVAVALLVIGFKYSSKSFGGSAKHGKTQSPANQKEEGEELVATGK